MDRVEEGLMALLLASMTLLTTLQVLLRYVFNTGIIWSLEATTYLFAWLVLVGLSYGVRSRSHIAVDLLVRRLAGRDRRVVALLATLVCLAYSVMMLSGAVLFVWGLYKMGHDARDIPVPKWLLTAMLPIGFGLLTLRFTELGIQIWRGSIRSLGMSELNAPELSNGERRDPEQAVMPDRNEK